MSTQISVAGRLAPMAKRGRAIARALDRFIQKYRPAVQRLTDRHPWLADLAISFPGLLFALAVPNRRNVKNAVEAVIEGRSLAEIAGLVEVPLWLRKLPPEAFTAPLPKLPDGAMFRRQIANHLPAKTRDAGPWLALLAEAADIGPELFPIWVVRIWNLRQQRSFFRYKMKKLGLWAWFSANPEGAGGQLVSTRWSMAMDMKGALRAMEDWCESVESRLEFGEAGLEDIWFDEKEVDGFAFTAIRDVDDLRSEALLMRNCIRSYSRNLITGGTRLWRISREGKSVATMAIVICFGTRLYQIEELRAPDNKVASEEVQLAAQRWLWSHEVRLAPKTFREGKGHRERICQKTWQSIFKPYWLAKGKIPDWLPIRAGDDPFQWR